MLEIVFLEDAGGATQTKDLEQNGKSLLGNAFPSRIVGLTNQDGDDTILRVDDVSSASVECYKSDAQFSRTEEERDVQPVPFNDPKTITGKLIYCPYVCILVLFLVAFASIRPVCVRKIRDIRGSPDRRHVGEFAAHSTFGMIIVTFMKQKCLRYPCTATTNFRALLRVHFLCHRTSDARYYQRRGCSVRSADSIKWMGKDFRWRGGSTVSSCPKGWSNSVKCMARAE